MPLTAKGAKKSRKDREEKRLRKNLKDEPEHREASNALISY
jgi:hypothetical protein